MVCSDILYLADLFFLSNQILFHFSNSIVCSRDPSLSIARNRKSFKGSVIFFGHFFYLAVSIVPGIDCQQPVLFVLLIENLLSSGPSFVQQDVI